MSNENGLEKIGQLAAYRRGYADAKAGRDERPPRLATDGLEQEAAEIRVSSNNSTRLSPQAMADRANAYQAQQAKLGRTISNADAAKHVYFEAGVPLE